MAKFGAVTKLDSRHEDVTIGTLDGQPVTLRMKAPRLGVTDRIRQEMGPYEPEAPQVGLQKDERGRVLKGPDGRPVVMRNMDDPAYLEKSAAHTRATSVALVMECLRDEVTIETKREQHTTPVAYWLAVLAELGESGIDQGIWHMLNVTAARLTTKAPTRQEIEQAREALGAPGN